MSSIILPSSSVSSGKRPASTSLPSMLHRILRKYSCLGYERKLRESVSMPTNRLRRPIFDRPLICSCMASFSSWNTHRTATGARAEGLEQTRAVVSKRAEMKLLVPDGFVVHKRQLDQHCRFET